MESKGTELNLPAGRAAVWASKGLRQQQPTHNLHQHNTLPPFQTLQVFVSGCRVLLQPHIDAVRRLCKHVEKHTRVSRTLSQTFQTCIWSKPARNPAELFHTRSADVITNPSCSFIGLKKEFSSLSALKKEKKQRMNLRGSKNEKRQKQKSFSESPLYLHTDQDGFKNQNRKYYIA